MKYCDTYNEWQQYWNEQERINQECNNLDYETLYNLVINIDDGIDETTTSQEYGKGAASGAGWALGAGAGVVGAAALHKKGIDAGKVADVIFKKSNIPYAIAGAALIGGLATLLTIRKRKKKIEFLLRDETDLNRKESLRKELSALKNSELNKLRDYKKQEDLAKVQADLLAKKGNITPAINKKGAINKDKINKLKQEVKSI